MKTKDFLVWMMISVACSSAVFGQTPIAPTPVTPDNLIDRFVPPEELDANYDDVLEQVWQQGTEPINLNVSSRERLMQTGVLRSEQIDSLLSYIRQNGALIDIYELQAIPLFDQETIQDLLPFVTIKLPPAHLVRGLGKRMNGFLFTRFETVVEPQRGYLHSNSSSRYQGPPGRIYTRAKWSAPGELSLGFTAEKDAGETFAWRQGHRGFDFYSGYLQLNRLGPIQQVTIGDFVAQFGQGLTLGGGFGVGKGSETITTLRRTTSGFSPYASANEFGFFRGTAISTRLTKRLRFHVFASRLYRDASVSDSTEHATSTVLLTGKHRTPTELASRRGLLETNFGAVIEYRSDRFEGGIVAHQTRFGRPFQKQPSLHNGFEFAGSSNTNVGTFFHYSAAPWSVFGECTRTLSEGWGWVVGALNSISRQIDVSFLMRSFGRNFSSFYTNAISESTAPRNETGLYWGWKHALSKKVSYTAFTDFFFFPWLKYRVYQPSRGTESLCRFNYRLSREIDFYVQFRFEDKPRNHSGGDTPVYGVGKTQRFNWIVNASVRGGPLWCKVRMQFNQLNTEVTSRGFGIAFDVGRSGSVLDVATRIALFDTDDFDTRVYMSERDLPMAFAFPAYQGVGIRSYGILRWKPLQWLDVSLKVATTSMRHQETLGSGGDLIDGNRRHEWKGQLLVKF